MNNPTLNSATDSDAEARQTVSYHEPLRTWAGHGTGAACNLCGRSINTQEIEYELELPPAGAGRSLRFHFDCYRVWEAKRPRGSVS